MHVLIIYTTGSSTEMSLGVKRKLLPVGLMRGIKYLNNKKFCEKITPLVLGEREIEDILLHSQYFILLGPLRKDFVQHFFY